MDPDEILRINIPEARKMIKQLERTDNKDPRIAQLHLHIGVTLITQGRGKQALGNLRKCIRREPENTIARIYISEVFAQEQRYLEAAKELELTGKYDPNNIHPSIIQSQFLTKAGEIRKGLCVLQDIQERVALETKDTQFDFYATQGYGLLLSREFEQSIKSFTQSITACESLDTRASLPEIVSKQASAYRFTGDVKSAKKGYLHATEISNNAVSNKYPQIGSDIEDYISLIRCARGLARLHINTTDIESQIIDSKILTPEQIHKELYLEELLEEQAH